MKKIVLLFSLFTCSFGTMAQTDILDSRSYGIGQTVTVSGVVTNGSELGSIRYMQDGTAGIAGYGGPITGASRYDSVTVTGPLVDFNGLLEISTVTNIVNHGPAVNTQVPIQIPITSANETLESQLVELQNVTFVQTGNFAAGNSTVQVTDGTNTLDVRINGTTNIDGTAIPTGPVTITGLVGQFSTNYQIVPRDLNDIVAYVAPAFEINVLLNGTTVLNNNNFFIGNSSTVNVTIENQGSTNLVVTGASFTGADAAMFSSDIVGGTIAGLSSQNYTINFTPTGNGSKFASIQIGSNDTDENPYTINFEGVGLDNLATEPTANASGLTFPLLESYTVGGQYNAGVGATKYIVLWKNGSAITGVPADATTYLRGDVVGDARVAYVGTGTSFTPRGVIANQDYYFAVYAFNGSGGFENYLTTNPATGNVTSLGENIGSYYGAITTSSPSLRTDLTALINPHTQISYFNYKQTVLAEFEVRDTTLGRSVVTCVYSGENKIFNDPFDWTATGYSREHSFAHSWMPTWPCDNPEEPEYTDQHNLFPSNLSEANSPRSNLPLGEIDGSTVQSYLEGAVGFQGSQMVYEPRASHKGNAARAIFYMATAYNFKLTAVVAADKQDQDLLKNWHFADLPDNYEIARNEYIYDLQGNRNPFIDSVDFVCHIDFDQNTYIATGCSADVNELVESNLVVYPIPSKDIVYVQVNGAEITAYELVDMAGKVVSKKENISKPVVTFDGGDLNSGTYFIKVQTLYGSAQKKMIID